MDEWTIMYYASGAGGLSVQISENIAQLSRIGSQNGVNFVCQYASRRYGEPAVRFRSILGGKDHETTVDGVIPGTVEALLDFIDWTVVQFPAQRYGLILLGHGSGWRPEDQLIELLDLKRDFLLSSEVDPLAILNGRPWPVLFTSTAVELTKSSLQGRGVFIHDISGHSLDSVELTNVSEATAKKLGGTLEFMGFDACLMSCAEIATAIKGSTNYLVASQQLEPASGWPQDAIAKAFIDAPRMRTVEILKAIPKAYIDSYRILVPDGLTMAVIDLSQMQNLANMFGRVGEIGLEQLTTVRDPLTLSLNDALTFKADLWDINSVMVSWMSRVTNETMNEAIHNCINANANTIVSFAKTGSRVEKASGLSCYIPGYEGYSSYYDLTEFGKSGWGNFIKAYRENR